MRTHRIAAVAAAAMIATAGLAGCSSSSGSSSSTTPAASPTASQSPSQIGGSVLPPVMVAEDQNDVTAKVGDVIVFDVADPLAWKLATSDPSILEIVDGKEEGGATFNPGATALAAGKATVTLTPDSGQARVVIVTVTE